MAKIQRIAPCLWFDHQAEEAAKFYTGIFKKSKIVSISRYSEAGFEIHRRPAGSVMVVAFELEGQAFTALNGGPIFKFNEAVSLSVDCRSQQELDELWEKLSAGGSPGQCGWLEDRYGLSWQIVPAVLPKLLAGTDPARAQRVMAALMGMTKLDIRALEAAADAK